MKNAKKATAVKKSIDELKRDLSEKKRNFKINGNVTLEINTSSLSSREIISAYNSFSSEKSSLNLIAAKKGFLSLLNEKKIRKDILSGIFFHLGEISQLLGNNNKAVNYFDLSIKADITHKMARQELKNSLKVINGNPIDILLISSRHEQNFLPYAILSLASYLKQKGYNPVVTDISYTEYDILKLAVITKGYIGFSVTTPQIPSSLSLTKKIKALKPETKILWGGIHPTLFPEQTVLCKDIDFAVIGDGEYPLYELLAGVKKNEISGLAYNDNGTFIKNINARPFDMTDLKHYEFKLTDMETYLNQTYKSEYLPAPSIDYLSSRGCTMNCSFCVNSNKEYRRKWNCRDVNTIIYDIKYLVRKFNIRSLMFSDPYLFSDYKRIDQMSTKLIENKIELNWAGAIHLHNILENKKIIKNAKKAGFSLSLCGAESGSDRMLKLLNKHISVARILETAKFLAENKISGHYFFMYLMPDETKADVQETIALIYELEKIYAGEKTDISFSIDKYIPIPGTKVYDLVLKNGFKEPSSLKDWGNLFM